jgi:hypothetical protein
MHNLNIKISCDISGYSDKYSGEYIVAQYGNLIEHDASQLNSILNLEIRRKCQQKIKKVFFITFYQKDNFIIIWKKNTNLKSKSNSSVACTQLLISISKESFIDTLLSIKLQELLFNDNYDEYINYFIQEGKAKELLFNEKDILSQESIEPSYIVRSNIYTSLANKNIFLCHNKDFQYFLYFLIFNYNNGEKISFISMDYVDAKTEYGDLFADLSFNKILYKENDEIQNNFKKKESKMKDVSLSKINHFDLEKILKITSESIKIELDILKTLNNNNDSSFFSKKKIDHDKINTIIEESIIEIIRIQKFKKQVFDELIEKLLK